MSIQPIDLKENLSKNGPTPAAFIRMEGLSKSYQEGQKQRVVLNNVHAGFEKGAFIAILGKSGTGKSTLLNLISGIDDADSGRIWFEGTELTGLGERDRTIFRREKIGFIFQFYNLIPTLTVWENVTLPLELNSRTDFSPAEDLLEKVGLLDRRDTYPDKLSGGEQQRVAIARALVHDPLLVLADEPTGNLDEETGGRILVLLDQLTRERGKNMIMVTHSIDAARFADRILYLRDGAFIPEKGEA
jgi:putative ABC transport system ATP-binding protein